MMVSFATTGRRLQPDLAVDQRDGLVVIEFEIDHAVLAETLHQPAGLGIQADEPVTRRDVKDAFFLAVGPIRESAPRELPRSRRAARAFMFSVHPQQFAGRGVERDRRPPRSRGGIQHAVDHQRRSFQLELGTIADALGLEVPRDLELVEVRRVDLIQRPVPRPGKIRAMRRPLGVFETHLRGEDYGCSQQSGNE